MKSNLSRREVFRLVLGGAAAAAAEAAANAEAIKEYNQAPRRPCGLDLPCDQYLIELFRALQQQLETVLETHTEKCNCEFCSACSCWSPVLQSIHSELDGLLRPYAETEIEVHVVDHRRPAASP